jgi:photosystem II stability/assembly factor-like uncharacterized protein
MYKSIIIIFVFAVTIAKPAVWENLLEVHGTPMWNCDMNSEGTGVAVGVSGICYLTNDYGKSWTKHYPGTDKILNYAGFTPDGGILVTGHQGTIVYFDKPGSEFEDRSAEPVYNLKDFIFTNDKLGFMISERYYLLKTTEGGKLWEVEKVFREYPFMHGIINIDNTLYLATGNRDTSVIYKSVDDGKNWDIISIFPGESIRSIRNFGGNIWICGAGGLLANSKDGGKKWNWYETKLKKYITDVEVIGNEIWINTSLDKNREILFSKNQGKTWEVFDRTDKCDWSSSMKIIGNEIFLVEDYHGKVKKAKIK